MLVLQGAQGLGKTMWFKKLVPEHFGLIKDGFTLRTDDKDSLYQCLSHWLVELGELDATFRKSDIAQLKAFITADRDIMRLAYAAKQSTFVRRTVFFASVNQKEFLHDETGNRRFWVIPCVEINCTHSLDMQQVWAQFYDMWQNGEPHIINSAELELVNFENRAFESIDSVQERIASHFNWDNFNPHDVFYQEQNWMTATQIAKVIGIINPTNSDSQKCSNAIKKLNGNNAKRQSGTGARLLLVPNQKVENV
jgi:putative DNA primase/helicase